MSGKYVFSILGGDRRQAVIARNLMLNGHTVRIYGVNEAYEEIVGAEIFSSAEKAVNGSHFVLLPLPVSRDNIHLYLNVTYEVCNVRLDDIIDHAVQAHCRAILGGMLPQCMLDRAKSKNISIYDYYGREGLQLKNALPSAEGALMIAMENTDKVIKNMPVVISGYGRIGKCLADLLYNVGADVTVIARRDASLCEAAMKGYRTLKIDLDNIKSTVDVIKKCDVIFNTAPSIIFTKKIVEDALKNKLYIEIASPPGGIDLAAARTVGTRVVFAPSLPGKYAPVTAGEYIYSEICDIVAEMG